jgi:hypothetical protein
LINKYVETLTRTKNKTNTIKSIDLKRDLKRELDKYQSPTKKAKITDLKKDLTPNKREEIYEKDNGSKIDKKVPEYRKFSILDIPAFTPQNTNQELRGRSKAYFIIANSE